MTSSVLQRWKGGGGQQAENIKSCIEETGNLGSASNSTVTLHGIEFERWGVSSLHVSQQTALPAQFKRRTNGQALKAHR